MKPPKSKMSELAHNATGGEKSHAEAQRGRGIEFKQTELGPIPVDWEVKRFDDTFEHVSSKPFQLQSSEYRDGGRFQVVDQGQMEIVGYTDDDKKLFHVPGGGVIIFGDHTRIIKFRESDFAVGADGTHLLIGKNDCTRFLFYVLQQLDIPNLGYSRHFKYVKEGRYAVPSTLAEQRRIAEALSDIDELISALGKLIEKKRNIKTGAMQELLGMRNSECGMRNVPRRRLPGFSGAWVEKRFDECFIHVPSKAYQIQATSYLGGGIYDVVDQGQSDVVGYTNDDSRLFRVPKDGVIIFGDHTRIVKFRKKDFVVGADGTQLLIGKDADTKFLSLLLGILEIPNLGYSRHFKYVKEGRYLLPPTLAEQKAIAAVLSDIDAEIAALEADRAKYERIKSGMMQELLTGKTRLKGE